MRGRTFRPFGGDRVAIMAGDDSWHDTSCFADEVVIDFPSIAPALARMRRAFLADERPRTLRTAIQLSRREAVAGATLPLAVAVRCTCGRCGGRGESWTERCPRCDGDGLELLRHLVHVTVPAGILDGTRFHFTVTPRHNPPTRIELHVLVA